MKKILMIGPSYKTKGGISAVINAYHNSSLRNEFNIKWIETYHDQNNLLKIIYFINSFILFLFHLPSSSISHIHLSEPVSAIRKSFYFIMAKVFFKKTIIHLHSFDSKTSIASKYKHLYTFIFSNCDKVIVLSPYWRDEVKFHIPNCNVEAVYNPCPKIDKKIKVKEKIILFAGTLNQRKGYSLLIESFGLIARKHPDWRLVFAGNGEIENGIQLAKEHKIDDKVEFLGWLSGEEKNMIFESSMIFCLPSFAEGFPMAILDALACGLPVISTTCGRIDMVLEDNENILFFEMGNISELANNLDRLMLSKELRNKIGDNGYRFSQKNFEVEIVVKKVKEIYNNI